MRAERGRLAGLLAGHSWLGLICSWVLALVFLTGAMTMFQQEIDLWEKAPASLGSVEQPRISLDRILSATPIPSTVRDKRVEVLLPGAKSAFYHVYVYDEAGDYEREHAFHPVTGAEWPDPQQSYLGEFLEEFHKRLFLSEGRYIVGIATAVFLLNIITGLVIHWPKLTWRGLTHPRLDRPRLRWLDLHVSLGIFALPFLIVITFTGTLFSFSVLLQQSLVAGRLHMNPRPAIALLAPHPPVAELAHIGMRIEGTDTLIADAARRLQMTPTRVSLLHVDDRAAMMTVIGEPEGSFAREGRVSYRLSDRSIAQSRPIANGNALARGESVLLSLHYGDFGGFALRLLYFVLAVAGCILLATGNLHWIEKRLAQPRLPRGLHLVAGLSVGTCGGGMVALAGSMMAARLLPPLWPQRADAVVSTFVVLLLASEMVGLIWRRHPRRSLIGLLAAAGFGYALLPPIDWLVFGARLPTAIAAGDWAVPIIELLSAILALTCFACARWLRRDPLQAVTLRRTKAKRHEVVEG